MLSLFTKSARLGEAASSCRRQIGCTLATTSSSAAAAPSEAMSPAAAGEEYAAAAPMARVTVNGRSIDVPQGIPILEAASRLGIYIPTLCAHPRLPLRPGTCRLCLVEQQDGRLVPACATPAADGAVFTTDSPAVQHSVRSVLSLLRANHPLDCMTCDQSGSCEFQDLLRRYNVADPSPTLRHAHHEWDDEVQSDFEAGPGHDRSSGAIEIDLDKCLRCGRCVSACGLVQEMNVLGWTGRGSKRHPGVMAPTLDTSKCIECGQCAAVCPVGAIRERSEWRQVADLLDSRRLTTVAMVAPSVRVALGEELGLAPGAGSAGQMVSALRALGFDHCLDVNFAADLTIVEEGTELLQRLRHAWGLDGSADGQAAAEGHPSGTHNAAGPLPMFTSCCPGWVTLVEKSYPELLPHLSTCKSPQQMMGAVVKRFYARRLGLDPADVALVSVMPCTAKKSEAERPQMGRPGERRDVDWVLTTRELGHLLRLRSIPLASLPDSPFDDPLGESSGAAALFGATGGVMEAALRTAYQLAAGSALPKLEVDAVRGLQGVKEAVVTLPEGSPGGAAGREIRVAVASGVGNARHLLERMRAGEAPAYDFVEVMACPGGCIGGGGQPKTKDPTAILKRMGAIYSLDERSVVRTSHDNPSLQALYKDFLGQPGGALAHELLHTSYSDRSHVTVPEYSVAERAAAPERPAAPAATQQQQQQRQ